MIIFMVFSINDKKKSMKKKYHQIEGMIFSCGYFILNHKTEFVMIDVKKK